MSWLAWVEKQEVRQQRDTAAVAWGAWSSHLRCAVPWPNQMFNLSALISCNPTLETPSACVEGEGLQTAVLPTFPLKSCGMYLPAAWGCLTAEWTQLSSLFQHLFRACSTAYQPLPGYKGRHSRGLAGGEPGKREASVCWELKSPPDGSLSFPGRTFSPICKGYSAQMTKQSLARPSGSPSIAFLIKLIADMTGQLEAQCLPLSCLLHWGSGDFVPWSLGHTLDTPLRKCCGRCFSQHQSGLWTFPPPLFLKPLGCF